VAQIFTNQGLTLLFNQLGVGATPSTSYGTYYVGLFTGSLPTATATLSAGMTEMVGSGYARSTTTFGSPTTATAYNAGSPTLTTTLNGAVSSGQWVVTLASTTGLAVGMSIVVGTEAVKIITGLPGANQVVLSSALVSNQSNGAAVTAGDAVSGVKSAGSAVTFSATGTWLAAAGYFVATSSDNSGKLMYAANFADATTPTLGANDTLQVTPTWLMSN